MHILDTLWIQSITFKGCSKETESDRKGVLKLGVCWDMEVVAGNKGTRGNLLELSCFLVLLLRQTSETSLTLQISFRSVLKEVGDVWDSPKSLSACSSKGKTYSSFLWWALLAFGAFWTKNKSCKKVKPQYNFASILQSVWIFRTLLALFFSGFLVGGGAFLCNKMFGAEMFEWILLHLELRRSKERLSEKKKNKQTHTPKKFHKIKPYTATLLSSG